MNIEHIALNVSDPIALADWYTRHLGMRVVRAVEGPPHTRFLADASGRTVLEVYRQKAPVPDYQSFDPMVLHIAFVTADIPRERDRLLAAGASGAGDISRTPNGDELLFLRDPWGITLQFVKRATPLI
ncbi:glyoxalase [Planctomycetaceae bacterium SCGC AG-212-F19]|nr:glyoxalase [Planctomycetaceae bacterium SCGC AG-212-F19]